MERGKEMIMKLRHHIYFCLPIVLLVVAPRTGSAHNPPGPEMRNPAEPKVSIPAGTVSMPMLDFGGRPGVNVRINGKGPFAFMVDTGTSQTVIDSNLATELSLPVAGGGNSIKQLVPACPAPFLHQKRVGSAGSHASSLPPAPFEHPDDDVMHAAGAIR